MTLQGQCLCGAVRFTAEPEAMEMGVCHCSMCRRWAGGAFMAVSCNKVAVQNDTALGVYESSAWGQRCFCKECGSTLFWRMKDGSMHAISAQAFDDPSAFAFTQEIMIDSQPANYAFANTTKRMTEAEVMAQFAPGGST